MDHAITDHSFYVTDSYLCITSHSSLSRYQAVAATFFFSLTWSGILSPFCDVLLHLATENIGESMPRTYGINVAKT